MPKRQNYGPGSFRDLWDNERLRSLDRGNRTGSVTNIPIPDEYDPLINDYFPPKGEAYSRKRRGPYYDTDLGKSAMGTEWNQSFHYASPIDLHWSNITRSDLRPDLNPEKNFYGKGPRGHLKSEEAILDDVCRILYESKEVDASDIEVSIDDQCIYLKGSIRSKGMKRVAEDLVASIPGVVDVFNELKFEDAL